MPYVFAFIFSVVSFSAVAEPELELNCLAMNIYHEARGESLEGQFAVAYVTMNRVVSPRYPGSVCSVVWQRSQFSWTQDGKSDRPRDRKAWGHSQALAKHIYNNYHRFMDLSRGASDLTGGALYYYAHEQVNPYWAKEKTTTATIGAHVFLN
ncbi:MAG: cell wall hydrolase [Gammaproteobacteria bacterium]|nr:cell wall hydrolase [Gammaproteobacteria bacterium]